MFNSVCLYFTLLVVSIVGIRDTTWTGNLIPPNENMSTEDPNANMNLAAQLSLYNGKPISEEGVTVTCSHDLIEGEGNDYISLALQIGILNKQGEYLMPIWTAIPSIDNKKFNAQLNSEVNYDWDTRTLSLNLKKIASPLIGTYVCLLKNINDNIIAGKAIDINPIAGVLSINVAKQNVLGAPIGLESYLNEDYNGDPFTLLVIVNTQDEDSIPTISLHLDGHYIEGSENEITSINKRTVYGKLNNFDSLNYEHTMSVNYTYIRAKLSHGKMLKFTAKTNDQLAEKSIILHMNITGGPVVVSCNEEEKYFAENDNNEIACIVTANPNPEIVKFVVGETEYEPEIKHMGEYNFEYKLRFDGKIIQGMQIMNFVVDSAQGMEFYPIKLIAGIKPTQKIIVVPKKKKVPTATLR